MALLKKIKSATLVEAIVATILVVIIFVIASLVLTNLVLNTFSKNTHPVETRLNELEYQIQNTAIHLPYHENYNGWEIEIKNENFKSQKGVFLSATNENGNKTIERKRIYTEN